MYADEEVSMELFCLYALRRYVDTCQASRWKKGDAAAGTIPFFQAVLTEMMGFEWGGSLQTLSVKSRMHLYGVK